ncbi:hypothetical protein B481_0859 [Planococcus halocryophilus Or1]|nr:hypothetical protein [Planococcus halocryophilus]EMF47285.1 hypothetical protein B481_0859 [Planococcus halocryophilus Or1]
MRLAEAKPRLNGVTLMNNYENGQNIAAATEKTFVLILKKA